MASPRKNVVYVRSVRVNRRLDSNLTLSVFESVNGALVNSVKNVLFTGLQKHMKTTQNFLCIPCKSSVVFVKLKRLRARIKFDMEDLKGSQINVSEDRTSMYMLSEASTSFLSKLSTVDLQVKFEKDLGQLTNLRFLNDHEIVGVMFDFRHSSFCGADLVGKGNATSWSLLRIHCELLDNSRSLETNAGVLELLRSDQPIVDFHYFKETTTEKFCVLLEDSRVYEIRHEIFCGGDEYSLENIEWHLRFPDSPTNNQLEFAPDHKRPRVEPTIEFIESNLQVRLRLISGN